MARTIKDKELDSRAARGRLVVSGKPHYRTIESGCHIGYRKGKRGGKWVVRIRRTKEEIEKGQDEYEVKTIGTADDVTDADGVRVLDWKQAQNKAREECTKAARAAAGIEVTGPYTVEDALTDYMKDYRGRGRSVSDTQSRIDAFILPRLGDTEISKLTTRKIKNWHDKLSKEAARVRTRKGKKQKFKAQAVDPTTGDVDPEEIRRRRASANRNLTVLKAVLNHAWAEGKVESDNAWRRVKPFKGVDVARIRYLSPDECVRLVNSSDEDFRKLVQGGLHTGARYGELARLEVRDFNAESGTVHVRESKSGKDRHVVLTHEGIEFFKDMTTGREKTERIFLKEKGGVWKRGHQVRPIADASENAEIEPAVNFHALRHTYASHLIMAGVSLQIVADNLGHADTRMVEKHYGHLADSHKKDVIRSTAPALGVAVKSNVERLSDRRG